jgi:hypothetical protein
VLPAVPEFPVGGDADGATRGGARDGDSAGTWSRPETMKLMIQKRNRSADQITTVPDRLLKLKTIQAKFGKNAIEVGHFMRKFKFSNDAPRTSPLSIY